MKFEIETLNNYEQYFANDVDHFAMNIKIIPVITALIFHLDWN